MDDAIVVLTGDADSPGIAAHLAVLNEGATGVGFDVDFQLLAAERTCNGELVAHSANTNASACARDETGNISLETNL